VGMSYYYLIQVYEYKSSANYEYASYQTSSALLLSQVSIAGKGEIDTVSNFVLRSGGGKIYLSWDAIPNEVDENYTKTYEILRWRYEDGQNVSGNLFTVMNTSYTDSDFYYENTIDDTYYYTIFPIITSLDGKKKKYGLESTPLTGKPSMSTP